MTRTDDLIGRPWVLGARGPDAFDCWGVVLELARRAGRVVPPDWVSRELTRAEVRSIMAGESRAHTVRLAAPAEGSIAYSEHAAHCGYVLHGRVIHAQRSHGVVAWTPAMWLDVFPDGGFYAWRA